MVRSYQPKKRNLNKLMVLPFLALVGLWLLLSPYGLWQYTKISRELSQLQAENARLEVTNQDLRQKIERLKNDPEYLEEVARREHGLIKENELIFDFSKH